MIYFTYNIPPPTNIINMFGNWLNGVPKEIKDRICIGVSALCWSIWTCRNNIIFNNQNDTFFLQVLRLTVHWIMLWSYLLPKEQREHMVIGCNKILTVAHDFYFQATRWRHIGRIVDG
jgi:hypothetical protein